MEPGFRGGEAVMIPPAAPIRRGDQVAARTLAGEVTAKPTGLERRIMNPAQAEPCPGERSGRSASG